MSFRGSLVLVGILGTALLVTQAAPAGVITFQQVPNGPLSTYTEAGFTASVLSGSWASSGAAPFGSGSPAPFIQFLSQPNQETTGAIQVTSGGSPFTFGSVDLYSSVTPIPYAITGSLNSTQVFSLQGTIPNTFGNFAIVANPQANALIDKLTITLTNPEVGFGIINPMGLDNIVVTPAAVPEPGTLALFSSTTLLLLAGAVLRKHRRGA
jgi:hypothetical protein